MPGIYSSSETGAAAEGLEPDASEATTFEEPEFEHGEAGVEVYADAVDPELVDERELSRASERNHAGASKDPIPPGYYTVAQGDCLASIAFRAGFAESTIWRHPSNQELRRKGREPNILSPGDTIFVPEMNLRHESCATDQRHLFRRRNVPAEISIRLLDYDEPLRKVPYLLEIDGTQISGTTDGQGYLHQSISPDCARGKIIINPGPDQFEYEVTFGGVDPLEEISGIQSRLINLSYDCEMTGELDQHTKSALAAFQADRGLPATGQVDAATRDELQRVHEE